MSDYHDEGLRILFTVQPGLGHLHGMIGLARELRDRGHSVTFASSPSFVDRIASTGFPFIGYGPRWVETRSDPLFWQRSNFPGFLRSADTADVEELAALLAGSPPELVVRDYTEFAGWVLARRLGIPLVTHGIMHRLPTPRLSMICGLEIADVAARNGIHVADPVLDSLGETYLDVCPPSFQLPLEQLSIGRAMRPEVQDTTGLPAPPWLQDSEGSRPLVYASLGTVFNTTPGMLEAILAAVRDQPYEVLLTTGQDRDPATLGPLPANVHAERYVSQSLVLPRCAATITHGGFNSCIAAFTYGVPLLVLPIDADQPVNAVACAAAGAGINAATAHFSSDPRGPTVDPTNLDVRAIREGVATLVRGPGFAASARRLGEEIAQMPSCRTTALDLELLVSSASG